MYANGSMTMTRTIGGRNGIVQNVAVPSATRIIEVQGSQGTLITTTRSVKDPESSPSVAGVDSANAIVCTSCDYIDDCSGSQNVNNWNCCCFSVAITNDRSRQ